MSAWGILLKTRRVKGVWEVMKRLMGCETECATNNEEVN